MSSLFDALSEELFQILKGSGKTLTLYGPDGNKTYEPSKARRVFAQPDNIMLSVIEAGSDSDVRLYLSQSTDVNAISKLIDTLRMVSTRYNVLFNVRKFGRELSPKDFAYQTVNVQEAAMYGTTRTSYQRIGDARMVVKHTAPIREDVFGSRSRNILSIFVETIDGERFKFPPTHLAGARAFARHIDLGGRPHDEVGTQITELAFECVELGKVGRYVIHSRNHLGEAAQTLRNPIRNRIVEIRRSFASLSGPLGYKRVVEAGLPLQTTELKEDESVNQEINRLMEVLGIDSNHALAESLMPVALLTMGENMTTINEMFHGVIALDEAIANELIEALISEYGYSEDSWTVMGENLGFHDAAVFEDATGYLDLNESLYALHEDDQFMTFATQYMNARHRQSGENGEADNAAITELADGIKEIFNNQYEIPEVGEEFFRFRNGAPDDYILSLYVEKHVFNNATGNFLSNIIAKNESGEQLLPAEKVVMKKLVTAFKEDMQMGESVLDEGDGDMNYELNYILQDMSPEDVLNFGGLESTVDDGGDPAAEWDALSRNELVDTTRAYIFRQLEGTDALNNMPTSDAFLQNDAEQFVDNQVIPFLQNKGYAVNETIDEFAMFDDRPDHHGIAAGDKVSTDLGYAQVISVEGDMATVEFLNGMTKVLHVDDMDKVDGLGESREERELAEWFDSMMPEAVLQLGELSMDKKHRYFNDAAKMRGKLEKSAVSGDEEAARKMNRRDRGLKMAFDKMREGVMAEGVTLPDGALDEIFGDLRAMAEKVLKDPTAFGISELIGQDDTDEENMEFMVELANLLSGELKSRFRELGYGELGITYEDTIGGDKGEDLIGSVEVHDKDEDLHEGPEDVFAGMDDDMLQKKLLAIKSDPKYADYRMALRKELLRRGEQVDEAVSSNLTFDTTLDLPHEDDVEVTVDYYWDDDSPVIEGVVAKSNGETFEFADLDAKTQMRLHNEANEDAADRAAAEQDYKYQQYRDRQIDNDGYDDRYFGEGKLGNPHRNEDDDACAHCGEEDCHGECYAPEEVDEAAELNNILKNAMFRK